MASTPPHSSWFDQVKPSLKTSDGKEVQIIKFNHLDDAAIMKDWALHFRRHYCSDEDLKHNSASMGKSAKEYLHEIKYPNMTAPGPSVRSGDFSEILVADYIQYILSYYVPRTRYDRKSTPNSSTTGTDILAFKISESNVPSEDELLTCETKASLQTASNQLQDAIDDSVKDHVTRLPFALNATYQRLKDRGEEESLVKTVERFMNKTASPYEEVTGAFLVCSHHCWSNKLVTDAKSTHPNPKTLFLAITGDELMELAHKLYDIAIC